MSNYQLESRMRENRPFGSEGGGVLADSPYPYQCAAIFNSSLFYGIMTSRSLRRGGFG